MKMNFKNILVLPFILGTIVSCNNTKPDGSVEEIESFLNLAKKSYIFKARETDTVTNLSTNTLMYTETCDFDYLTISGENARIDRKEIYNGSTTRVYYVKGERGYVSRQALNNKNEVMVQEVFDESTSRELFDTSYLNPFLLLEASDFILPVTGHTYELNEDKYNLFMYYFLGTTTRVSRILFHLDDKDNIKFDIYFESVEYPVEDAYTNLYVNASISGQISGYFEDLGVASREFVSPKTSKNVTRETALETALQSLSSNNYTIVMNEHYEGDEGDTDYDSYWYFDGESIYHQAHLNDQSKIYDLYYKADKERGDKMYLYDYDEETGTWVYNDLVHAQAYNVSPKTYDECVAKFAETSPLIFDYDETKDIYVINDEDTLAYIGLYLLPGVYQIKDFSYGMGNKCEIKLNGNKIDYITVGYYAESDGYDVSREYTMRIINQGTTSIPSWVE